MKMLQHALFALLVLALTATAERCPACQLARNGVHPIKLDYCGPAPSPVPPINTHHVAPEPERPPIHLPAVIPPPQTVAHICHGQKTVVKPQVYRQLIIVPYLQRYLRTSYKPIVETINYKHPLPCGVEGVPTIIPGNCQRPCSCGKLL